MELSSRLLATCCTNAGCLTTQEDDGGMETKRRAQRKVTTQRALLEHPYYVSMAAEGGRRTGLVGRISSPQMRYGYKDWVGYVVDGDTQCI